MAESTQTPTTSNGTPAFSSSFQRTVTLYDWWIVKSQNDFQGFRLAVSGVSSRKEEAVRVFNSAPIIKRHDLFSLETADGIYVIIKGFINEQRTLDNGFTPEIFKSFLFGFPPNWESYALDCFREESETGTDRVNAVLDNVSGICQAILSDDEENSIHNSLVLPEEAPRSSKKLFAGDESKVSKEMSGVDVACGSGGNRCSTKLHNSKVCKQKKQLVNGGPLKYPDKDHSSTSSKALENRDSDVDAPDNVSAILPEISSDAEKSFPTSLVSPEMAMAGCKKSFLEGEHEMSIEISEVNVVHGSGRKRRNGQMHNVEEAPGNCKKPFPGDECKVSKEMSGVDVACGRDRNRRSTRLHNNKVCHQKQQPASGGSLKLPDTEQNSASKAVENHDSDTAVPVNVSANLPEISSDDEKSFPTLVSPEKASGDCKNSFQDMSFEMIEVNVVHGSGRNRRSSRLHNVNVCQKKQPDTGVECKVSKEMNGVDVACGSGGNRRNTRLRNIKVCQQKQQPVFRGPLKHPGIEQCTTSKTVENRDSDTAVPDDVSENLPEISSDAMEKIFTTTFLTPEKAAEDCKKAFLEDEHDMSIKTTEVNVVRGSGGTRCSARLHNVKICQRKQRATGGPPKSPDKDQICASAALEKSGGGLESPSTPIQSQSKGLLNTSEQVSNKVTSRISKTFSAKTEGRYKKKKVTVETEAVKPKRKSMKPASSKKSPQEKDASHLNKGSKQRLSFVSPESLSLKKSRSGRLVLPPLEFWRNQIPIYNADHEITEIQEGSSLNITP